MTHTEMQQRIQKLETYVDKLIENHNEAITHLTRQLDKVEDQLDFTQKKHTYFLIQYRDHIKSRNEEIETLQVELIQLKNKHHYDIEEIHKILNTLIDRL